MSDGRTIHIPIPATVASYLDARQERDALQMESVLLMNEPSWSFYQNTPETK
jgi:hypothetical protein